MPYTERRENPIQYKAFYLLRRMQLSEWINNPLVEIAAYTKGYDTEGAESQSYLGVAIACKRRQRIIVLINVHSFNDEQIIIKTDNRINQCHKQNDIRQGASTLHCRHEDEELAEHTCKGRNTTQREESKCHEECQLGIGCIQAVVSSHFSCSAVLFFNYADDGKDTKVSYHINQDIIRQSCQAHVGISISCQHDVSRL